MRDDWQPECSLNTLTDGLFGTVKEGKLQDHTVFIWLSGYLDEDTGYSIEEIIDYLQYQLNITEYGKESLKKWNAHCIEIENISLKDFSEEEKEQFEDFLNRMYKNLTNKEL